MGEQVRKHPITKIIKDFRTIAISYFYIAFGKCLQVIYYNLRKKNLNIGGLFVIFAGYNGVSFKDN